MHGRHDELHFITNLAIDVTWKLSFQNWLMAAGVVVLIGLGFTQLGPRSTSGDVPRAPYESAKGPVSGYFYERLGELEGRLAGAPADAPERIDYALLLHDAHRHEEAAAELERYLAARPDNRQGWLDLANIYGAIEDWDAAARSSQSLLDRYPDDAAAQYNLGAIAANRGQYADARNWWSRVAENGAEPALAAQAVASLAELARLDAGERTVAALPPGHPPIGRTARYLTARPLRTER